MGIDLSAKYQVYKDVEGKYRFRLLAANNKIVVVSQAYDSKINCMKGIEAVKNSCAADINDLTTNKIIEKRIEKIEKKHKGVVLTGIAIENPPNVVESGSVITFEGWLIESETGEAIGNAPIEILEKDRSFMDDTVLASGVTDKNGSFKISWKSYQADWWDDSVEIYARYKGTENYKPIRSANYRIRVV